MFFKIAHRGASGYFPENTLLAFQKAIESGANMLEFDVHCCQSGEIVVIHDETLDRTTNGSGLIKNSTLAQLQLLDAGMGEKIPTLKSVLKELNGKIKLNIELKGDHTALPVFNLLEETVENKTNHWTWEDFLISSFKLKEITAFNQKNKQFKIGLVFMELPENLTPFLKINQLFSIHLPFQVINSAVVNTIHAEGLKLLAWTVDNPPDIQSLKALNMDGIFSNYPDRL